MSPPISPTSPLNTSALHRLLGCLRTLREATGNDNLQMQTMNVFLFVASRHPNEVAQVEIAKELRMVQTTVSRNCNYLWKGIMQSSGKRIGGYRLVESFEDPVYRRYQIAKLTDKGLAVARTLTEQVGF